MEFQEILQEYPKEFRNAVILADRVYEDHNTEKSTDTQWTLKYIDNVIYIAFAGTDSLKDICMNVEIAKQIIPYDNTDSNIRVHSGFIKAYKSVRDQISHIVKAILPICMQEPKIFISGHSLGGAIALLCAIDIQYNFNIEPYTFTFGQPRVGNAEFAKSTVKRLFNYFRFVNGDDTVTMFPKLGYYHCPKLVEIGNKSKWKLFSFEDHKMNNYKRILLV